MDIYRPIIIFFDQISQNMPILKEFFAVIIILGILAGVWLGIVIFFTFATVITAILWLPQIFKSVYNLGIYHPLVEQPAIFPCFGEYETEKFWKVLKANIVVGASLLVVLIYIFNTLPTSFFDVGSCAINSTANQTFVEKDQLDIKILNGAFALALIFIPSFLKAPGVARSGAITAQQCADHFNGGAMEETEKFVFKKKDLVDIKKTRVVCLKG